jgi:hypothetical protein
VMTPVPRRAWTGKGKDRRRAISAPAVFVLPARYSIKA